MKALVDKDGCIGCQSCVSICPEVFRMDTDGVAEGYSEVTKENYPQAKQAEESCPVAVISISE